MSRRDKHEIKVRKGEHGYCEKGLTISRHCIREKRPTGLSLCCQKGVQNESKRKNYPRVLETVLP